MKINKIKNIIRKNSSTIVVATIILVLIIQTKYNNIKTTNSVKHNLNRMETNVKSELIELRLRINNYAQEISNVRRIIIFSNSDVDKELAHNIAETIVTVSNRYESVSVSLLTSVIFTESRFNKDIVSRAGAMGLGQLMPETVAWICREWNLPFNKNLAFNYENNIKMTAWYLDWLFHNAPITNNDIERTLAYYNGGGNQSYRWGLYKQQLNGVILDSLETYYADLLYEETKQYVIKVMDRDSLFKKQIDKMLPTG